MNGLTSAEVKQRKLAGKVNSSEKKSISTKKIILKNTLTLFNFINLVLVVLIFLVHSYKNSLSAFIALFNTLISIFNELRAKKIIDKLKIISEKPQIAIRDGKEQKIKPSEIVKDDLLKFSLGDQIPVDCIIKTGALEVNESFLTGESDDATKNIGDKLLAGSFVVSGECCAVASVVGQGISLKSDSIRELKTNSSPLFNLLNEIIKIISYSLIPIGALFLWKRFNLPDTTSEIAITSTVAALISMIPEGLILLTSSILALASIRLAKQKTLVQDLYSVETLARVDTICLDKTGTLTTGKMRIEKLIPIEKYSENDLKIAISSILSQIPADNPTSIALLKKFGKTTKDPNFEPIFFSSKRKFSGIKSETENTEILMGALEFMTKNPIFLKKERELSEKNRLISILKRQNNTETLLGFVILSDELRKNAKNLLNFFYENNIEPKIISGDNLSTAQVISENAGLKSPCAIDLSLEKSKNYAELVKNYNIFARVNPEEKQKLVLALKKQRKTVAMTGDGVNDVLALKEADCSISIGEGADSARRISKIVLLDSDFSAVPNVIREGRQVINNIERSATLFLTKTIFASILTIIFIFFNATFPFSPIEMSIINFFCIGFPAFILALEPNSERIKNQFLKNIISFSIPTAITVVFSIMTLSVLNSILNFSYSELLTISALTIFVIYLSLLFRISKPLNRLRKTLFLTIIISVSSIFFFEELRNFIGFSALSLDKFLFTVILIAISELFFVFCSKITQKYSPKLFKLINL